MNKQQSQEKTPLQKHLEQLFSEMKPDDSAPENIKDEVFDTISSLELVGDIAELFTGKFGASELELFDLFSSEEEE